MQKEIIENKSKFFIYFKCNNSEITAQEAIKALEMLEITIRDLQKNFLDNTPISVKVKPFQEGSVELIVEFIVENENLFYIPVGWVTFPFIKTLFGFDIIEEYTKSKALLIRRGITDSIQENYIETALFVKNYVEVFLKKTNEELDPLLEDLQRNENISLDKSVKARSVFFESALTAKTTDGIGFQTKDNEIIPRDSFYKYIRDNIIRELPDIYEYKEFEIYKPVLKAKSQAKWGVSDYNTNELRSVRMADRDFSKGIIAGLFPLKTSPEPDVIKCEVKIVRQLKNGEEHIKSETIIKVYTFNGHIITPLPEDFIIGKQNTKINKPHMLLFCATK